jgi:hypothetical protein
MVINLEFLSLKSFLTTEVIFSHLLCMKILEFDKNRCPIFFLLFICIRGNHSDYKLAVIQVFS